MKVQLLLVCILKFKQCCQKQLRCQSNHSWNLDQFWNEIGSLQKFEVPYMDAWIYVSPTICYTVNYGVLVFCGDTLTCLWPLSFTLCFQAL